MARIGISAVDLHKADDEGFPLDPKPVFADRYRDYDLFFGCVQVLNGYLRAGKRFLAEGILPDFLCYALVRRIDQPVRIHEGEAFQVEKLLHVPLIGAHMLKIAQILRFDHADGDADDIDVVVQIVLDDLLAPADQLVQIQRLTERAASMVSSRALRLVQIVPSIRSATTRTVPTVVIRAVCLFSFFP